ncbi:stage III sporulation protein AB [Ligaoa zhengdingensis]|nr:stage III sporulation protein AB [Ligaoa zhengdingensis]
MVGLFQAARLRVRTTRLEETIGLVGMIASDLRYTCAPMENIVRRLTSVSDALPFLTACAEYTQKGEPFPNAWRQALKEAPSGLDEEDVKILRKLGLTLGAVDLDGALSELDYAKFALGKRYEEARERQRKLGGLYRTLGVLAGFAIVIVLF